MLRPVIPISGSPPGTIATRSPPVARAPAGGGAIARVRCARVFVGEVHGFLGRGGCGVGGPGGAGALGPGAACFAEGGGADGQVLDLGAGEDAEDRNVFGTAVGYVSTCLYIESE